LIAGLVYNQSMQRKKANLSLSQLNSQLDEANKIKTKFFNIINHDLRGPVAGFINLLHLQQNEGDLLDETKQRKYIAKAAISAENLLETMEDLLLWSKGQMENFKPHIKPVSVESLFDFVKKSIPAQTVATVSFQQLGETVLHTDEHYIKTIMHNLTNNAIKALGTQPNGTIEWRGWQEGDVTFLAIKDNGPGATDEQLRPLYDETATIGIKNGLGLHIVRDMAKAIGCNILVNNKLERGIEIKLVFI
jgi:signal transduction histidine kinase